MKKYNFKHISYLLFVTLLLLGKFSALAATADVTSITPLRTTVVYPISGNQYNNFKQALRFMADKGPNGINEGCQGDDNCGNEVMFLNPGYKESICSRDGERYLICAKREECTALNIECTQNEIDYRNAQLQNRDLSKFVAMRKYCNQTLLPACNRKMGIMSTPSGASITNPNPSNAEIDANAYGWFNESCIVTGYQKKLKNVISYATKTGVMGKCYVNPASPYLTDKNPATNCDNGGKAPNCLCLEALNGYVPSASEIIRQQTPREAGLCIDIPLPQLCKTASVAHATFNSVLIGVPDVIGQCEKYWTNATSPTGTALNPTLSCLNIDGNAQWETAVRNPCVRYSCPSVLTSGPNANGVYQGGYGYGETAENIGRSNGFATWAKYTKTNDLLESRNAIECIAGFKKVGSAPIYNSESQIIGYSGGISPVRDCSQLGTWQAPDPTKICQRIQCPAITPPNPTSATDYAAWNKWYDSAGATFPATNASRSSVRIQNEAVAVGICNNSLGFFQSPGGLQPTRECDYLGNWKPVKNPCVTNCSKIANDDEASSLNNGFSKWNAITGTLSTAGTEGVFAGCVTGYVTNPYPPATDIDGKPLPDEIANDLTRPAELPRRMCKPGIAKYGVASSVWAGVNNGCINKCAGSDIDPRIGVGVTVHAKSNGNVAVNWSSTDLGSWDYQTNWTGSLTDFNASYFKNALRTNGYYLLRRKCNSDGKWSEPEVMCSMNDGQIDNAKYFDATKLPGLENSIPVGSSTKIADAKCLSGYWAKHASTSFNIDQPPQRVCTYASTNKYIDKVYLDLASSASSVDCEAVSCPPVSYLGERAKYNVPARQTVNTQIQATCLNNEKNSLKTTVYTLLENGAVPPTIFCQNDGTWSKIENEISCKKGCDLTYRIDMTGLSNGCGGDSSYANVFPHTLQHGQRLSFLSFSACTYSDIIFNHYGEKCDDGIFSYKLLQFQSMPTSHIINTYNYQTNNFDGPPIQIPYESLVCTMSSCNGRSGNSALTFLPYDARYPISNITSFLEWQYTYTDNKGKSCAAPMFIDKFGKANISLTWGLNGPTNLFKNFSWEF